MGVSSSVVNFNEGYKGLHSLFEKVFLEMGSQAKSGLKNRDRDCMREMWRKYSDRTKKAPP